jgi:hypothetical protein
VGASGRRGVRPPAALAADAGSTGRFGGKRSIATRALPVSLALENIAALFEWPKAEMDEADFPDRGARPHRLLLLLDISNLYANARNHGFDALDFLDRIPLERLAYVHIGGGIERDGLYHDTHRHPVVPEALALLEELCARPSRRASCWSVTTTSRPRRSWRRNWIALAGAGSAGRDAVKLTPPGRLWAPCRRN